MFENIEKEKYCLIEGFNWASLPLLLEQLQEEKIVVITKRLEKEGDMKSLVLDLFADRTLNERLQVSEILPWDINLGEKSNVSPYVSKSRVQNLGNLFTKSSEKLQKIIFLHPLSLIQKTLPFLFLKEAIIKIDLGQELSSDNLARHLINYGYRRTGQVLEVGEFCARGDVMDVYSSAYQYPVRIELFGSKIEQINFFDPIEQTRIKRINNFYIYPANEIIFNEETRVNFLKNLQKNKASFSEEEIGQMREYVETGMFYPGIENHIALFYDNLSDVLEYIGNDEMESRIIIDQVSELELGNILEKLESLEMKDAKIIRLSCMTAKEVKEIFLRNKVILLS